MVGLSFFVTDGDLAVGEIHVADAQAQTFDQAQPRAVEQAKDQFIDAIRNGVEHELDLGAGQQIGAVCGLLGAKDADKADVHLQDLAVAEEEGAGGLFLGRGGHMEARWMRKALISAALISRGWRLL